MKSSERNLKTRSKKNKLRSIFLNTPENFSFKECYTFINRSSNECLHFANENYIRKLLRFSDKFFLIEITQSSQHKLKVKILNNSVTKKESERIRNFVAEWFDLTTDLTHFYTFASSDKLLKTISAKYSGLRLIGIPDLFEAMTWAIIGQQINLAFAYSIKRKFVEKFGERILHDGTTYHLYPTPEKVSKLKKDDLLKLQFSIQKATYVIEAAKHISEGRITKENLKKLTFGEAKEKLCEIKGVGNWTANYVIMKCLRDPNAFPIEDVGLHNAIKNNLKLNSKPTLEQIRKMSKNWTGWYAYSTFYLWRSLIE